LEKRASKDKDDGEEDDDDDDEEEDEYEYNYIDVLKNFQVFLPCILVMLSNLI
jgi:hypothetical protein